MSKKENLFKLFVSVTGKELLIYMGSKKDYNKLYRYRTKDKVAVWNINSFFYPQLTILILIIILVISP